MISENIFPTSAHPEDHCCQRHEKTSIVMDPSATVEQRDGNARQRLNRRPGVEQSPPWAAKLSEIGAAVLPVLNLTVDLDAHRFPGRSCSRSPSVGSRIQYIETIGQVRHLDNIPVQSPMHRGAVTRSLVFTDPWAMMTHLGFRTTITP